MKSLKLKLNASTVLPMVAGFGVVIAGPMLASGSSSAEQASSNPDAVPYIQLAQCNPCNPCAANPCNPCAANNPCNPCAANPCNPCNPCAARANPCNPCAANPCNPCAAAANPCNPCAANPCNPCAAGGGAHSSRCFVPRLRTAGYNPCNPCAAANPCNPCAAANPCNPCAANPCNPCAAANPCNPCAANPCNPCAANPCNPCGAAAGIELTPAEALAAYDCMKPELRAAYGASGNAIAINYQSFDYYSTAPYVSALHGSRYVTNVANQSGSAYGRYEEAGTMRNGSVLAKDSFLASADGRLSVGPLFLMQKMPSGFNAASADWKYTMVMPDGSIFGETNGTNSAAVQFCIDCHEVAGTDHMFFLPVEFRVN